MKTIIVVQSTPRGVVTHGVVSHAEDTRMVFLKGCVERWGAVAATPGQIYAQHQAVSLATPEQVVERAVALTELVFAAGLEKGYLIPIPDYEDAAKALKELIE